LVRRRGGAGWRLTPATVFACLLRDATLPWLWLQAWMIDDFEWRGHAMSTADESAHGALSREPHV
jgi:ceramide glucosyltransferase